MKLNDMDRAELDGLRNQHRLEPEDVRELARDPASSLHRHYDWDKDRVHEEYLLEQSRHIIRSYKIVVEIEDIPVKISRYIPDPVAQPKGPFVETLSLRDDKNKAREAVLSKLRQTLHDFNTARTLAIVLGLRDELDELITQVGLFESTVRRSGRGPEAAATH
jgi:hypothetical protein